jgi:hypothetical protein
MRPMGIKGRLRCIWASILKTPRQLLSRTCDRPDLERIGTKIEMIFRAQLEPQAASAAGKELLLTIQLTGSGDGLTSTAECDKAKSFRQNEAILQLCRDRIASEILPSDISLQFAARPEYAVSIKGRLPASRTETCCLVHHAFILALFTEIHADHAELVALRWILLRKRQTEGQVVLRKELNDSRFEVVHRACNLYAAGGFEVPKYRALFPNACDSQ